MVSQALDDRYLDLINEMMMPYRDLDIKITAADVQDAGQLELAKSLGCSEAFGPAIKKHIHLNELNQ